MYLYNFVKLLFVLLITTSVGFFFYTIFAYFDGRVMEKEYKLLAQQIDKNEINYSNRLVEGKVTEFEIKKLSSKYNQDIYVYVSYICYSQNNKPGFDEKTIVDIDKNNEECKKDGIPKDSIRPEIEKIYAEWSSYKTPLDNKIKNLTKKVYANESEPGKIDTEFINMISLVTGMGFLLSIFFFFILLFLSKLSGGKTVSKKSSR